MVSIISSAPSFNTQPLNRWYVGDRWFQHTAAQRRLRLLFFHLRPLDGVSTHSRPKAAAYPKNIFMIEVLKFQHTAARRRLQGKYVRRNGNTCFNTQPPEGGCFLSFTHGSTRACFNTQPHEGGCLDEAKQVIVPSKVSTHSRTKAAAPCCLFYEISRPCFNTQPHEGGCAIINQLITTCRHSFNTQPHEGGCLSFIPFLAVLLVSTHSRTKAAA